MPNHVYVNIEKKREYLGPVLPADVWPANDIPFCSKITYFQYSLIHDLALIFYLVICNNFGLLLKKVDIVETQGTFKRFLLS